MPALAQFRVEVSGVGLTQVPIALVAFRGDDVAPQKIAAIVQADLERSGQFRSVDATRVVERFGGGVVGWTVTREELETVDGIGKKKADAMWRALGGDGGGC